MAMGSVMRKAAARVAQRRRSNAVGTPRRIKRPKKNKSAEFFSQIRAGATGGSYREGSHGGDRRGRASAYGGRWSAAPATVVRGWCVRGDFRPSVQRSSPLWQRRGRRRRWFVLLPRATRVMLWQAPPHRVPRRWLQQLLTLGLPACGCAGGGRRRSCCCTTEDPERRRVSRFGMPGVCCVCVCRRGGGGDTCCLRRTDDVNAGAWD